MLTFTWKRKNDLLLLLNPHGGCIAHIHEKRDGEMASWCYFDGEAHYGDDTAALKNHVENKVEAACERLLGHYIVTFQTEI